MEDGQMWLIFCSSPQTVIQLTMIHMDQMILSEPSSERVNRNFKDYPTPFNP
jgi:hypothetical protein